MEDGGIVPSVAFSGNEQDAGIPFQQKVIRTLEDGPTSRQKALVISIWIVSALFGASTCFPEKGCCYQLYIPNEVAQNVLFESNIFL